MDDDDDDGRRLQARLPIAGSPHSQSEENHHPVQSVTIHVTLAMCADSAVAIGTQRFFLDELNDNVIQDASTGSLHVARRGKKTDILLKPTRQQGSGLKAQR